MLLNQKVKNKWHVSNKEHYEKLGYSFTAFGEEFEVDVNDLSEGSNVDVIFSCDYCGEKGVRKYAMLLKSRKHINKDCCYKSECISKKKSEIHKINPILEGESLDDKFPHLIPEWHVIKNSALTPYDISKRSHRKVWWICSTNPAHEWDDRVSNRTRGRGCPYCSGKRVNKDNCLATLRPDIACEWNYIRNRKTPNDYTIGSGKKVWWICKCGHEWEATISHRTNGNTGCPACFESKGEKS